MSIFHELAFVLFVHIEFYKVLTDQLISGAVENLLKVIELSITIKPQV